MKMLFQIAMVALVVGGVSAGGSYYWHQQQLKLKAAELAAEKAAEKAAKSDETETTTENQDEPTAKATDSESTDVADASNSDETKKARSETKTEKPEPKPDPISEPISFGPPVAVRPPYDAHGDEAGNLINKLRARAESASRQERRVVEREDTMRLIMDDLRFEQAKSTDLRKRILEETNLSLRAVDEARRATETERTTVYGELSEARRMADEKIQNLEREKEDAIQSADSAMKAARDKQEDLQKQLEALRKPAEVRDTSGSPEETANLKKMVGVLDSMPAENTAKDLMELVQKGRIEAVVALLNAMKPRVTAKVISAITETQPTVAADLIERLKRLKKDGEPTAGAAK